LVKKIKKKYLIKNVISRADFQNFVSKEKFNLDYNTIDKFKSSQLNSENFQDRLSCDSNIKKINFFNALSFWINFFKKHKISSIILEGLMHGANYDSLALDVAKFYSIPSYVIESHMRRHEGNDLFCVRSVLEYSQSKRIFLDLKRLNLKPIDINKYLFYENLTLEEVE